MTQLIKRPNRVPSVQVTARSTRVMLFYVENYVMRPTITSGLPKGRFSIFAIVAIAIMRFKVPSRHLFETHALQLSRLMRS
jgi:hypothetical protein